MKPIAINFQGDVVCLSCTGNDVDGALYPRPKGYFVAHCISCGEGCWTSRIMLLPPSLRGVAAQGVDRSLS